MLIYSSYISCGVIQIAQIGKQSSITGRHKRSSSKSIEKDFKNLLVSEYTWKPYTTEIEAANDVVEVDTNLPTFAMFSDAVDIGNGQILADIIKRLKLGKIQETPAKLNINSKRDIKVWIWHVNHKALKSYLSKVSKEYY